MTLTVTPKGAKASLLFPFKVCILTSVLGKFTKGLYKSEFYDTMCVRKVHRFILSKIHKTRF
nr:MAG TPA: hypothetical protein [Caudoviricetes sp.]